MNENPFTILYESNIIETIFTKRNLTALFDVLKLYGPRITELHLRQSKNNIWTEAFGQGDIDYPALAKHLLQIGIRPHIVMEQAVETGTPKTMSTIEAFQKSSQYARKVFAAFA